MNISIVYRNLLILPFLPTLFLGFNRKKTRKDDALRVFGATDRDWTGDLILTNSIKTVLAGFKRYHTVLISPAKIGY